MALNSGGVSLQANLPALLAGNQLQINEINVSTSIQRLSTGLRINSAADDPAGSALASRLQSKINVLDQGTLNAQDGISVVQSANGGLSQVVALIQQLGTLAAQASKATLTSTDRQGIQTQVNQLIGQINQVVSTTQFGNQSLLDGSIAGPQSSVASSLTITTNAFLGAGATPLVNSVNVATASLLSPSSNATCFLDEAFQIVIAPSTVSPSSFIVNAFASGTVGGGPLATLTVDFTTTMGALTPLTITSSAGGGATFVATLDFRGLTISDIATIVGQSAFTQTTAFQPAINVDKSLEVQVGASVGAVERLFSPNIATGALFSQQNIDVTTFIGAEGALVQVQHALGIANQASAILGAQQNSLQSTVSTNQVFEQNMIAARSSIVDLNVARETTNLVKGQVLLQSSAAVLAQANILPALFLQLFR